MKTTALLLLLCAGNAGAQNLLPPDSRLSSTAADVQALFTLVKAADPIVSAAAQNALNKVQGSTTAFTACAEKEVNFPLRLACAWKAPEATLRRLPPAPDSGLLERELRYVAIQALIRMQSPDAMATAVAAIGELPELKNHITQEAAKAAPYLSAAVKGKDPARAVIAATLLAGQNSFTEEEALALDGGPDVANAFIGRFGQYGNLLTLTIMERAKEQPTYRPLAYDLATKAEDTQTAALFRDVALEREKTKAMELETDFDTALDLIETSPDWTIRTQLCEKLYKFTPSTPAQFSRLLALTDSPYDLFTEAAETAVLKVRNAKFLPQIRQCLRTGGPNGTGLCARLAGIMKDKESLPHLKELLRPRLTTYTSTELKQAQSSALKALEATGGENAKDFIIAKLGALDGDAELELAQTPDALPLLLSLLDSPNLNEGNRYALSTADGAQMALSMLREDRIFSGLCLDGSVRYALSESQDAALAARLGKPTDMICNP